MVPALYDNGGSRFMVIPDGTSLINYDITNPASISQTWSVSLNNEKITSAPIVVNGYVIEGTTGGLISSPYRREVVEREARPAGYVHG